jgi:membrane dipeptidase
MRLILDAHLDLSWNAMSFDRDQTRSIGELRAGEAGMTAPSRGNCTVSLPEMRRGGVAVCLATLLCRALPESLPEMDGNLGTIGDRRRGQVILREDLDYASQSIACAAAQGQLAYYRLLESQGQIRMIRDAAGLDSVWKQWQQGGGGQGTPIGYILSMEGADPIVEPRQAEWWWEQGLRTACLAHYGPSAYAMGTGGDGPLTPRGRELLREFDRLGMILDLVHTADTALEQALEIYSRPVFVSHGNCRALVPHDRQISDEQIRQVAARDGVIGAVLDAWMLAPDYRREDPNRPQPGLANVADHIDYVCQLTGNARHAAIGSDLDGGFGREQSPTDLDTIADLQKLEVVLAARGYSDTDIDGIFHGNWLRFFGKNLPR